MNNDSDIDVQTSMLWKEDLAVISLAPVIGTVHEGGEKDVYVWSTKDTSSSSILGSDYLTSYATVVRSRSHPRIHR